jgi:hypothetical protein
MFRVINWSSSGGHEAVLRAASVQAMATVPQPIRTLFSCVQVRADSPIAFSNVFEAVVMVVIRELQAARSG